MIKFSNECYGGVWMSFLYHWHQGGWIVHRDRASALWHEFIDWVLDQEP